MRHGATAWNAAGRFQGQSDVELSPEGRAQARATSQHLSPERIDAIFASDLARALETARIVAEPHGVAVTADPRLREFDFGTWEGLTWAEITATRPELRDLGATAAQRYRPEGGESFADVAARVRAFVDEVTAGNRGHIVVVTHAGPLHAMLDVLGVFAEGDAGESLRRRFLPGSVTRVAMDAGTARLITLSDVRHLDPTG
ncbi:MAG: histidine phosphatase family protein [Candidatus Tumulicola sp.]